MKYKGFGPLAAGDVQVRYKNKKAAQYLSSLFSFV
jgi:hypothetical protein